MMSVYSLTQDIFPLYLTILMVVLCVYGLVEVIFPAQCITLWHAFVQTRFLPLYGVLLMIGGFPLTQYHQTIPGKILFVFGIVVVFTGPFILLFPGHFRSLFDRVTDESSVSELKRMAYSDAVMRFVAAGLIFAVRYL